MIELCIFNVILIAIMTGCLIITKKFVKSPKAQDLLLLISSLLTILAHYSSLIYHLITEGSAMSYLSSNPNLLLPIYPCNVVMWCCLVYGLMKNKEGFIGRFLVDFIFWFGIISCVVGMFANVDFIRNPGFSDYDTVKSVVAHAFMFYNVLLFGIFKKVKIDLPRNMINILVSFVLMLVIGLYCNLVFKAIVSESTAYNVNSMFLLHSPFDGLPFLKFPLISVIAVVAYFVLFSVCELFAYKKGNRWISRIKSKSSTDEKQA